MILQSLTSIVILSLVWKSAISVSQDGATNEEILEKGLYGLTGNLGSLFFKNSPNKNVFISPLSIYTSLTLMYKGADGIAKDELAKALGFPLSTASVDTIHTSLGKQIKTLQASIEANVSTANGLFVRSDLKLNAEYQQQMADNYDAQVTSLDFTLSNSTDFINQYISDKTKGRIPKVFTDKIQDDAAMVLANVLYFEAQWKDRFQPYSTDRKATFTVSPEKKVEVALMSNSKLVPYLDNANKKYRAIGLPYEDQSFTMFFVLPYENETLSTLSENFKSEDLQFLVNATLAEKSYVRYRIPRTKFSWSSNLDEKLKDLGVKTIFGAPDFSKMVNDKVYVSQVTHATDLQMDETGTTAAAVTTVTYASRSGHAEPQIQFEVNRPFMLVLYHRETKMVLFYGTVYNPIGN